MTKAAIVYWCGGSGHAARSIPVAKEFEERGIEVSVAGGGQGKKFVELNDFSQPDLSAVDDPADFSLVDFVPRTFANFLPSIIKRTTEIYRWLKKEDPDVLVTDDIFAQFCASIQGITFYRIDHITPEMMPSYWGLLATIYNKLSMTFGERIIITSLWPDEEAPDHIQRVGPLAQEGESDEIPNYDILLIPGSWGENFDVIREALEEEGYTVRTVGDESWVTKPSMTPYTEAAGVVVCTGFSSIADTVVTGTPCVVYPFLPFQKAVANGIESRDIEGITQANSVEAVLQKVNKYINCNEYPDYDNGASELVDFIINDC